MKKEHTEVEPLEVSYETCDNIVVVIARGEIDFASAFRFEDVLQTVIDLGIEYVSLDMRDVTYMDSEGIKVLLRANQKIHDQSGKLVISECSSIVGRTLEILGLQGLCLTILQK